MQARRGMQPNSRPLFSVLNKVSPYISNFEYNLLESLPLLSANTPLGDNKRPFSYRYNPATSTFIKDMPKENI